MSQFSFPTVFPCGRGSIPGTQGQGTGGTEPPTTPVVLIPEPPLPPDPPFVPQTPSPFPRRPGGGAGGPSTGGPSVGIPSGPTATGRPTTGGPAGPTTGGPAGPGQIPGPTTGGRQFFKCEVVSLGICPGEEGIPLNQATITTVFTECLPCQPNTLLPNGEVIPDPNCIYTSIQQCQAACTSPTFTNLTCPPASISTQPAPGVSLTPNGDPIVVVSTGGIGEPLNPSSTQTPGQQVEPPQDPSLSVNATNQSNKIISNQIATNANIVSADEEIEEEDFRQTQAGFSEPQLYDPDFNFFKVQPNNEIELEPLNVTSNIFNREVAKEVSKILSIQNSELPWDEITLQNLTDDKLIASLNPRLINAFQYLRYPGGKPIGIEVLLNVIRKHLLEGTINEFDYDFFNNVAEAQFGEKFEVLQSSDNVEYTERFAIKYLANNLYTFENTKGSRWRNFQINRTRPLNEDVNLKVPVTTVGGFASSLEIPNDGIPIDRITELDQITVPSIGSPDRLNIGNGGGYYIDAQDLQVNSVAVPTANIIPQSFYAPPPVRMKVLTMLDVDPTITITASSLENQHEFVSGDVGASAVKPLFFALNLSSVSGSYTDNALVENYSGSYSLLTASADIQTHLNNNALNTPMLCIDYRDPIYRYILDTSSVRVSLNDFNLAGFQDQGFSSIGSRFVKNIPFGLVITPVGGGKYNPFNGNSKLLNYGSIHVRSLSVLPSLDATIDGSPAPLFEAYNLNTVDGVNRVGIAENESIHNIGYRYDESNFSATFYQASSNSYEGSSLPASSYGTAFLLKDVIDYLSVTYSATNVTWYDVFSRMPVSKLGQIFYDGNPELIVKIANGLRDGMQIENIESGHSTVSRIIEEDSKTIVKKEDRDKVTRVSL